MPVEKAIQNMQKFGIPAEYILRLLLDVDATQAEDVLTKTIRSIEKSPKAKIKLEIDNDTPLLIDGKSAMVVASIGASDAPKGNGQPKAEELIEKYRTSNSAILIGAGVSIGLTTIGELLAKSAALGGFASPLAWGGAAVTALDTIRKLYENKANESAVLAFQGKKGLEETWAAYQDFRGLIKTQSLSTDQNKNLIDILERVGLKSELEGIKNGDPGTIQVVEDKYLEELTKKAELAQKAQMKYMSFEVFEQEEKWADDFYQLEIQKAVVERHRQAAEMENGWEFIPSPYQYNTEEEFLATKAIYEERLANYAQELAAKYDADFAEVVGMHMVLAEEELVGGGLPISANLSNFFLERLGVSMVGNESQEELYNEIGKFCDTYKKAMQDPELQAVFDEMFSVPVDSIDEASAQEYAAKLHELLVPVLKDAGIADQDIMNALDGFIPEAVFDKFEEQMPKVTSVLEDFGKGGKQVTSELIKQAMGWRNYSQAAGDADGKNRSVAQGFAVLARGAGASDAPLRKFNEGLEETAEASAEAQDQVIKFGKNGARNVLTATLGMTSALKTVKPHMNPSGKATLATGGFSAGIMAIISGAVAAGTAVTGVLGNLEGQRKKVSSSSRRRAAEAAAAAAEAARAAEEARKEAIRKAYQQVEHKKHLNQITLEEELAMLEKIRQKHKLNAEEIMEWEEKVYDVKKAIRERDSGSVDKLGDGVIEALKARYEAMREAEIERLDSSREAWEKWRDDSVKAIEDQIDALDKLAEAEDREKQDAEEMRKIAKLRQEIEFEQDEYNQMKLQQQLDQAIQSREERLRKLALQDQKEALREQIKGIQEQAGEQIKAIDEEKKEIQEAYEERMKNAAIRAEAERMLMTQSQEEIIQLLAEYAPDYDALGKTLGEKLLDGFQKKVGNIVDWFKAFNESLYQLQEGAAAEALASADAFLKEQQARMNAEQAVPGSTVVNQTVNFNEPVETPGQAARRLAQANEDMAGLIYG